MEVIFVRHTRVGVPKGTCYGWSDVPVADTFKSEAQLTKEKLDLLKPFDAVFSSPLKRAYLLSHYCGYYSPILDDRLKEMNMGDWEMQKYDEIKDDALQMWYKDYMHLSATNGESFPLLRERVYEFINDLKQKPYHRVAIFAHAGVLICAGLYAKLFTEENCWDHLIDFGGIQTIQI